MAQRMVASGDTLLKYDNAELVIKHAEKKAGAGEPEAAPPGKCEPPLTAAVRKETEEVLRTIIPPREWEEDGNFWRQYVSTMPATRLDVMNLQEQLDMRLQQRQARETGICPVRRELYNQCFDELIRQVTINCTERGLLMLRLRDELRMTITAYQSLYESSIAFGIRKALLGEQSKADLETAVSELKVQKLDLEKQVVEQRNRADLIEKQHKELRDAEEQKHQEEVSFLKKTNQQLKAQLEGILTSKMK